MRPVDTPPPGPGLIRSHSGPVNERGPYPDSNAPLTAISSPTWSTLARYWLNQVTRTHPETSASLIVTRGPQAPMQLDVGNAPTHRHIASWPQVQRLADADHPSVVDVSSRRQVEQIADRLHPETGEFLARCAARAFERGHRVIQCQTGFRGDWRWFRRVGG